MQNGRIAAAREFFTKAAKADPEHEPTQLILAKLAALDEADENDEERVRRVRKIGGLEITTIAEASDVTGATAGDGLWASAPALLEWLSADDQTLPGSDMSRRSLFEGQVLELGSGTGFVGLALAKLGASRVTLTDLPQRLPILKRNVEENGLEDDVSVQALAWGTTSAIDDEPDLIVASDVTYDAELVPLLATTLAALLSGGRKPKALLALPRRSHFKPPVTAPNGAVLPDSSLLFQLLREEGGEDRTFAVRRLDTVAAEPVPVNIFLVSETEGPAGRVVAVGG